MAYQNIANNAINMGLKTYSMMENQDRYDEQAEVREFKINQAKDLNDVRDLNIADAGGQAAYVKQVSVQEKLKRANIQLLEAAKLNKIKADTNKSNQMATYYALKTIAGASSKGSGKAKVKLTPPTPSVP